MKCEQPFSIHSFACATLRSVNERTYVTESKRVISYARVSTGAQAATGLSIDAQHRAVAAAAAARGWRVVERVTDEAVSGSVPVDERPGLGTALTQLGHGAADVLVPEFDGVGWLRGGCQGCDLRFCVPLGCFVTEM